MRFGVHTPIRFNDLNLIIFYILKIVLNTSVKYNILDLDKI